MNLRVEIDDYLIANLRERTGIVCASDLARTSLHLLNWATREVAGGNRVVAISPAGEVRVPVMDVLQRTQDRETPS